MVLKGIVSDLDLSGTAYTLMVCKKRRQYLYMVTSDFAINQEISCSLEHHFGFYSKRDEMSDNGRS
jgi:hypothetical protein